jgi:hypothetical protein
VRDPGRWQHDTAKYGLRKLPLRTAGVRPSLTTLKVYPGDDVGARLARARCEAHPDFRPAAAWRQGRDGLLSKYEMSDGTVIRFAVTAVAS